MLSILIPVYNFDVSAYIMSLHKQVFQLSIPFEILLLDDGSDEPYRSKNRLLQSLKNVCYNENYMNMGRAKTRNRLGTMAKYEYLLFTDCDAQIISENFIRNYLCYCDRYDVICGGTYYQKNIPSHKYLLHWKYGINTEARPIHIRQQKPYTSFTTHNFLIKKTIFTQIRFEENITDYGHEDTLFGFTLQKNNIPILHIDNPLAHIGLEETSIFLEKQKKALHNVAYITRLYPDVAKKIKLIQYYKLINILFLKSLCSYLYDLTHKIIEKQLKGKKPLLSLFALYKLLYFCRINK